MARVATLNSLPAPANFVVSSVSAGGTLAANTTYYYKIIAIYATTSSVRATDPIRSAPSQEISGTTDTTNKTINLSWTAVSGATGYMIWRTKASGDYRHKTTPEGNYFKCKALRTGAQSYQNYSTTSTTYSDNGTVSLAETTQGISHYLYYDFAVPRIDISGGDSTDSFSMEYLYQQDIANGWNVITRTGDRYIGYTYTVKAHIKTTAAIYWQEEKYFNTWVLYGGFVSDYSGTIMIVGYESSSNEWLFGINIIVLGHTGYYSIGGFQFINSQFYGVTIRAINQLYDGYPEDMITSQSVIGSPLGIQINGLYTWKGCKIIGGFYSNTFNGGQKSVIERCDFLRGARTFAPGTSFQTVSVQDLQVKNQSTCVNVENSQAKLVGGKLVSQTSAIMVAYGGASMTTVGTDFDDDKIYLYSPLSSAPGAQVLIKEPIDITVIDEQNIPIESVTVSLTNKNDDLQFSVVTDINGKITQQEVMRMYVFSASSATHFVTADDKTDYNPFTLTVSKTGYETYTSKFTLSEKIDSIITLKKWKRLRLDTDGKEYIAINPAKGSRSKILKS